MKIAVLGAMPEEIKPLLEKLQTKKIKYANNTFYLTNYKNHEIIIAYSKIGKVNSSLSATIMIEKFKAEILLFTGVAGALDENLKIGDMFYAKSLVQHDVDLTAFGHPFGYISESEHFYFADKNLIKIAENTAKKLDIKLHSGIIASGDQFISDEDKKNWIKKEFNADVVEMEGASVACVCSSLNIPFFILRAISDEAGKKAEFDFEKFVIESAEKSAIFVLKMIENI
ncbi:multifunctional 5'-methylthioadenosine / S-adenosylhomocysteine nucleosidase / 6-amino-6-deoxyfutalosine hydrolase [Campylobacter blaseri]|uniref:adenosylhomocysteine nucleosidase n=1 Tax=Campylobacter blaseri TaxID=2042961 RepID=A0A2P8QZB9_9BACT|nr:5'-methylthioadenosine/adenosylhomocysteine nucleosidase [Campylobacter blaseri]PSM51589.1 5'-methylthioadenosine/S-adenosylhomocysteine nucleosidase [Campylobacter blaseri]PSM53382.1 5'-methylthioadenosine/S-adenosylhomocysteine nucleosidase [Campylobacter blaseri]QKF86677.1 multifunctional 5'-methylthioadenosine / S-adenosylhomocysteine nucleosidase / 6-amino-6-deoxyfutalosine hydrolase [Campylobacter blaseri]